jgi:hypothetical protein
MANIQISSPFIKSFVQADIAVGTGYANILPVPAAGERRVVVVIQNKSDTFSAEVVLNATGTEGILIPPLSNISLDNYNGTAKARGTSSLTLHVAYGTV